MRLQSWGLPSHTLSHTHTQTHTHTHTLLFLIETGAQEVQALKVKCENLDNGCEWVGEMCSLKHHKSECGFVLVPCPYECGSSKIKKDLNMHVEDECSMREYKCPHCDESGPYKSQTTTHLTTCPKVKIQCPNNECSDSILRCELATHLSVCEYERTPCKFAKFGCEFQLTKKDLIAHEEDDQLHLQSTKEKVLQLTEQLESTKRTVLKLEQQVLQHQVNPSSSKKFIFKLKQFNEHKETSKPFMGPSFYSSPEGYKFAVLVFTSVCTDDGMVSTYNTHISVYVCILRGRNDSTLTWPFKGTVTVELLNQLEDRQHRVHTVGFSNEECALEIDTDFARAVGVILPHFILNRHLFYNPRTNCQYLKQDTLVFRVSVEIPDYKPWLESNI